MIDQAAIPAPSAHLAEVLEAAEDAHAELLAKVEAQRTHVDAAIAVEAETRRRFEDAERAVADSAAAQSEVLAASITDGQPTRAIEPAENLIVARERARFALTVATEALGRIRLAADRLQEAVRPAAAAVDAAHELIVETSAMVLADRVIALEAEAMRERDRLQALGKVLGFTGATWSRISAEISPHQTSVYLGPPPRFPNELLQNGPHHARIDAHVPEWERFSRALGRRVASERGEQSLEEEARRATAELVASGRAEQARNGRAELVRRGVVPADPLRRDASAPAPVKSHTPRIIEGSDSLLADAAASTRDLLANGLAAAATVQ